MQQISSTQAREAPAPSVVRLADATGYLSPASPQDVARHLDESRFVWLDLENPTDGELRQFGSSLGLDADTIVHPFRHPSQRSSFTQVGDSIHIALGAAEITATTQPTAALFISIVYTGRLLLTLHHGPFQTLEEVSEYRDEAKDSYLLYRRLARRFRVGTIPQIEE